MNKMVTHPDPAHCTLMTFEEFLESVESNCLTDYDGFGFWATETEMLDDFKQRVFPSDFVINKEPKTGFTHVVWFNR
jgi:hypothetical protein